MFKPISSIVVLALAISMSPMSATSKSAMAKSILPVADITGPEVQVMPGAIPVKSKDGAANTDLIRIARKGRRHRGNGHRHYRRRHRDGINPGAAAAIIIGGILLNEAFRASHRSDFYRCEEDYRSFRWSDGTFQPYGGGPRRLCPYLY